MIQNEAEYFRQRKEADGRTVDKKIEIWMTQQNGKNSSNESFLLDAVICTVTSNIHRQGPTFRTYGQNFQQKTRITRSLTWTATGKASMGRGVGIGAINSSRLMHAKPDLPHWTRTAGANVLRATPRVGNGGGVGAGGSRRRAEPRD